MGGGDLAAAHWCGGVRAVRLSVLPWPNKTQSQHSRARLVGQVRIEVVNRKGQEDKVAEIKR